MRYLVESLKGRLFLKLVDFLLGAFRKKTPSISFEINHILLCNGAHLGDVILSTSVLPRIKERFPNAKIGFLSGSWSKEILHDHVCIDKIHCLDHWRLNRSSMCIRKKIASYYRQKKKVLKELKEIKYDLAIDLYPFFPNNIALIYKANIPMRVGYTSAGWGPLLTHPIPWEKKEQSIIFYFQDLLEKSGLCPPNFCITPYLAYRHPLPSVPLPSQYVVFHIGTGNVKKEWSLDKWKALLMTFIERGQTVVFTGQGHREQRNIDTVLGEGSPGINLCNKLTIKELMTTLANASEVISVDTATVHIATAFSIPTTVLYSGITDISLWKTPVGSMRTIYKKTPCFPCLKRQGCKSMECIQGIEVENVCRGL